MSEGKSSGLRPPSKISRPCCNSGPKPSVPPSPPRSLGKNSMEHLWETHGRRLSEAGLRRGSDTSVVLTEDTDSFIIGDRVWVGGTKPGQIAYIGETQFAPGDWAGIVLDEPIGKNDGSVAGSRYFQCEPKRGVFSRLTRLTRQPLTEAMSSSLYSPTQKTPTSPTESTRGNLNKSISPSLNTSTTSLSSISHRELRLGDRVIVSSSQGSKAGILRFMGSTEFAAGEWCGIELDDPVGKNDGSVGENRYFECRPKYGLFAPIHKVSRSPSNKRTSTCIVHKPSGASLNMSLRKLGSKESLVSVSSIASTTASTATRNASTTARRAGLRTSTPARSSVQELLKEKQIEIEHLHKERDLERERVTRAANQADQAEQMVISIKQEHEKYRGEMEKKIQEAQLALAKLLDEKSILASQLEEERRKCEDLLFRFEEESVNKDDIQEEKTAQNVTNSLNENKIRELELKLSEERERVVQLEQDSVKLFEVEEELTKLRSEVFNAADQDQRVSEDLQKLSKLLEDTQKSLQHKEEEKNILVGQYENQMQLLKTQLAEFEKTTALLKDSESIVKNELEHVKQSLQSRNTIISEMSHKYDADIKNLERELEQYRINVDNITKSNAIGQEDLVSKYEKIITEKEIIIKQKTEELDSEVKRNLEIQKSNLEQLKGDNTKHIEELSKIFKSQLNEREVKIENISLQLEEKTKEIEQLKTELESFNLSKDEFKKVALAQVEDFKVKLKLADDTNKSLTDEIQVLRSKVEEDRKKTVQEKEILEKSIIDLKSSLSDAVSQLEKLNGELKNREIEIASLKENDAKKIDELTKDFKNQIAGKDKNIEELKSEIIIKLKVLEDTQKELSDLKLITTQKNGEFEELTKKYTELENTQSASKNAKASLEAELQSVTSNVAELNRKLFTAEEKTSLLVEQKKKLELDISNLISSSEHSSDQLIKYNEDLRKKEQELDEARDKVSQLENSLASLKNEINSRQQDLEKSQQASKELGTKFEEAQALFKAEKKSNEDLSAQIAFLKTRETELLGSVDKGKTLGDDLENKVKEVTELTKQLGSSRQEIEQLNENNLKLQKLYDEIVDKTNKEKLSNGKLVQDLEAKLEEHSQELKTLQQSKQKLENELNGREQSITELAQKLHSEAESKADMNKLLLETNAKLGQSETKLQALQEEKSVIENDLKAVNSKYNDCLVEITLLKSANDNSVSESQMKLVTAEKQLAHVTSENETLTKSLAEANQFNKELSNKYAEESENNKILTGKISDAESQAKLKDDLISELKKEILSVKEAGVKYESELTKVGEGLKLKQQELDSALKEKRAFEENIKTLQQQLSATQNDLSAIKTAEIELISKLESLTKTQEKTLQDIEGSKDSEIRNLRTEIENTISKNAELAENVNTLKCQIAEKDNEFSKKDKVIEELNARIKREGEAEIEKSKIVEEYKMKLSSQQLELDNITKQNADLRKFKESLETLLQEKEQSIGAIKESLNGKEVEGKQKTEELTNKLNLTSAELNQLKERQTFLEKELKQVNEKWTQAKEALKLASQNQKNLKEVEVVSNNQSIHAAGGDMNKLKNNSANDVDGAKLLEEYELARGQIDFLNSVIVDMKKKNDALTCKVEVLEMGIPPSEADDYNLNSLNSRMATPRMFCDICDQFDLHDTEDCPRQAQGSPEPEISPRTPKKLPVERPYCDICEAFGHDTVDCDDGETF